jgi:hypothetical protein
MRMLKKLYPSKHDLQSTIDLQKKILIPARKNARNRRFSVKSALNLYLKSYSLLNFCTVIV